MKNNTKLRADLAASCGRLADDKLLHHFSIVFIQLFDRVRRVLCNCYYYCSAVNWFSI